MLSKLLSNRQTHAAHHYFKSISAASNAQLMLLGMPTPMQAQPIMFQGQVRLFSTKDKHSSSETSGGESSDIEMDLTQAEPTPQRNQDRPQRTDRREFQKGKFSNRKTADPIVILDNIPTFLQEKGESMTNSEFSQYCSQVNRAIAISPYEARQKADKIKVFEQEIVRRLDGGNNLQNLELYADFITLCQSRNIKELKLPVIFNRVVNSKFSITPLPVELENLNFSELVSILWATNSNTNSLRIIERIDKAIEDPAFIKPINKIQQVLDKLCTQNIHMIRYSSLFDKLAQYLLRNEQFDQFSVQIRARLFKSFAQYQSVNLGGRTNEILSKLAEKISESLDQIQEKTVLNLLEGIQAYQYASGNDATRRQVIKLNQDLNEFVISMAVKNPDLVDIQFLIQYLSKFTELSNQDYQVPAKLRKEIFDLFETKVQNKDVEQSINREAQVSDLLNIARVFANSLPFTTQFAVNKFLSLPKVQPTYQSIHDARSILMKQARETKSSRDEQLLQVIQRVKDYNSTSVALIASHALAISEFPQSQQRDDLMKEFMTKFKPEYLNIDKTIELIQLYMRNPVGDQVRQEFIEKLCRANIIDNQAAFAKLNYVQKINLELTFLNSFHNKNECFVKREVQPMVQQLLNEKENNQAMSVSSVQQYLKLATYQFATLPQSQPMNYNSACQVLINIQKRFPLDSNTTHYVSAAIKDYIIWVLKSLKTSTDQEFNYFKKTALSILDEMPAAILKHTKKRESSFGTEQVIDDIATMQNRLGRIPNSYQKFLDNTLLQTEILESNYGALQTYIKALDLVGIENISKETKKKLEEYVDTQFDKTKFIQSLFSGKQTSQTLLQRLKFFELLLEMERSKSDPKITQKDFESALESGLAKIETNLQSNKWVQAFRTLLDLTEFKNQNLTPSSDRIQSFITQTLARTYFYPTLTALLDTMKDASRQKQLQELSQHVVSRNLLKGFYDQHKQMIEEGVKIQTNNFVDLYRIYCNTNWRNSDLHDSFIKGFGSNFEAFSDSEAVNFCESLSVLGLKQEDIFKSVLEKISDSLKKEEVKDAQKFRKLHYGLISSIFNVGLGGTELAKLAISGLEELYGKPASTLFAENLNLRQKINLMTLMLSSGQEANFPEFKVLVEEINKATEEQISEVNNDGRQQLAQAVRLSELNGLGLKPANLEKIMAGVEGREAKALRENVRKLGIDRLLKTELGFAEVKERVVIDKEVLDFYIPETNQVIMVAEQRQFSFDRTSLNMQSQLRKRVIENLPIKPSVLFLDLYAIQKAKSDKDKVRELQKLVGARKEADTPSTSAE